MNNNHSSACAIGIINNQLVRRSTSVENPRQIRPFFQNKPNFPYFSPENDDLTQKQTQFKPKQSQFWPNIKGGKAKTNPIKPNLLESKIDTFTWIKSFNIVYFDFIAKTYHPIRVIHNQLEGKTNVKTGKNEVII